MIGFVILTVFIAGLMVGRTPEYLGKKIEPREMRMAVLLCLATPIAILIGSGIACLLPSTADAINNPGAHGCRRSSITTPLPAAITAQPLQAWAATRPS